MQESTPDISMAPSPQNKPLDNVGEPAAWSVKDKGEDQVKTSSNEAPNLEENLDNWIAHSRTTETSKPGVQNSDIGTTTQKIPEIDDTLQSTPYQSLEDEYLTQDTSTALVTRSESEQSLPIATRDKVVSFDTQPQYLPEDSESESESESSVLSGSTPSVSGYEIHDGAESEVNYPTIKSRHAAIDDLTETASVKSFAYPAIPTERVDVGDPRSFLDARYQVHKQSEFQFGRVFKILWSEKTDAKTLGVKYRSASKFYVGFRRFIIVATEKEGHSTCVPILTYERRGCTKTGVNPKTHGIVYSVSGNPGEREPRLLKGEPELGFPPIKVDGYKDDEPLPKESRVNYAKLITIEHNVKVFFIGFIPKLDFDKVIRATNECWVNNMRGRR
ncbi:uncharacterized protein GGS22DRAFT_148648 [Annulohypoxylon maeteangense]|uniref:uncharacterized protein n=1 Tax=Annulohypoxylon maeteangense TaxID=1927788 RepID=UPI0020074133|nr:uncharacterized protein GGS22DRAFT_148648 [Annulohypoxylon maeteangense]KAI0889582.1 hypothetical protein GGS22DRAFT_148648 [Annulohypoxylon maeteangense]